MNGESVEGNNDPSFNPESVLLSHFTLERPKHWQWVSTGPHEGSILMEVIFSAKDPKNENDQALIYFNHAKPDAGIASRGATGKRWKEWFKDVRKFTPFSEPTVVGTNKVSFVEVIGTYQGLPVAGKPAKLRPGYTLFGAHIEDGEGNVLVRMVGPTHLVNENKSAFNEMIEASLVR